MKGTKIDVLLDPPQVCGSTDLQVGEFQVTIPGGVCPTDRDLSELNDKLRRLIKNGLKDGESYGDGSRSGFVYYVACELRRSGWGDGEIIVLDRR